jgi:hypothetical protein
MSHHRDRDSNTDTDTHILREILEELRQQRRLLHVILAHLQLVPTAAITVISAAGEIDIMQSTYKSVPGADTFTFQVFDNSTPPADITARCTFTATSDGPAVAFGPVSGATVPVTNTPGTANLTISAVDSGGEKIPSLVLAATIAAPAPTAGAITVTASNPLSVIA